jgi:hypothetical protein
LQNGSVLRLYFSEFYLRITFRLSRHRECRQFRSKTKQHRSWKRRLNRSKKKRRKKRRSRIRRRSRRRRKHQRRIRKDEEDLTLLVV